MYSVLVSGNCFIEFFKCFGCKCKTNSLNWIIGSMYIKNWCFKAIYNRDFSQEDNITKVFKRSQEFGMKLFFNLHWTSFYLTISIIFEVLHCENLFFKCIKMADFIIITIVYTLFVLKASLHSTIVHLLDFCNM